MGSRLAGLLVLLVALLLRAFVLGARTRRSLRAGAATRTTLRAAAGVVSMVSWTNVVASTTVIERQQCSA